MKASKKSFEEFKKEIPKYGDLKTLDYYEAHLRAYLDIYGMKLLNKTKKIIDIINEEMALTPNPYLDIPIAKFTNEGLLLADVIKILKHFSDDAWQVIRPFPEWCSTTKSKSIILYSHSPCSTDYIAKRDYLYYQNFITFRKALEKILQSENSKKGKLIELKSQIIEFDDDKAIIKIGKLNVALPPYKNEHYFCRSAFEYPAKEPIDWSIIYEKMTGYYEAYYGKSLEIRENWRLVYDTMRAVNERIKEVINTNDNLFTWQEKTLKRNY